MSAGARAALAIPGPLGQRLAAVPPWALAAAAGLLYYLGFGPMSWWPFTFLGAVLFIALLDSSPTAKQAALRAAAMKFAAIIPAVPYLSGLGLGVHAAAALIHSAAWALMGAGFFAAKGSCGGLAALLALPGLWTLAERAGTAVHFLPSHVTTWSCALAGPGLGLAPFTGAIGLSTLAVALAALPRAWRRAAAAPARDRRRAWALTAAGYGLLLSPPILGRALYGPAPVPGAEPPLRVAVLSLETHDPVERYLQQGQRTAAGMAAIEAHARRRAAKWRELLRGLSPELILLPEEAMRFELAGSRSEEAFAAFGIENNGLVIDALRRLAREAGADVATGLVTRRGGRRYNTAVIIGKDGRLRGIRDKWMLTPGSEYWPVPDWLPAWRLFAGDPHYAHPSEAFSWPEVPYQPLHWLGWTIGASICLEGHMPEVYLGWRRAGAELLLFLGNAHWFNWNPDTFNVHLLRTVRLSSAAYGLPVVMTGKENASGLILPDGTLQAWPRVAPSGVEAAHEVLVPRAPASPTVAARWGEYYLPLSALVAGLVLAGSFLLFKTAP